MGLEFKYFQILLGAISGILLFEVFWWGALLAQSIPGFSGQVSSVYQLRGNFPVSLIALLLLFPIGPAEAIYWQGLIQKRLSTRFKPITAVVLSSLTYTAIHLPTLNPSLMIVALIGGLLWGYLYLRCRNILPVILSHTIFDEFAFVFFMIG
jgi:membrane protease YdiL (CAAX protease family)